MKIVIIKDKQYTLIKKYKHFNLYEDEFGIRTCFNDFDLGLTPKRTILGIRRRWKDNFINSTQKGLKMDSRVK